MSNRELSTQTNLTYQFTFAPMTVYNGGTGVPSHVSATIVPNYYPSCSKILGISLNTLGGTASANVYAYPNFPSNVALLTNGFNLTLIGDGALDTSVYTIFWNNFVAYSPNKTVLLC